MEQCLGICQKIKCLKMLIDYPLEKFFNEIMEVSACDFA